MSIGIVNRHRNGLAYTIRIVQHMKEAKKVPPVDEVKLDRPTEEELDRLAELAAKRLPIGRGRGEN